MPTIINSTRIDSLKPDTLTRYWTRVLQMARANYYRNQAQFSKTAINNASPRAISRAIAAAYNVDPTNVWNDAESMKHIAKMVQYIKEGNSFAAKACLKNAETAAALLPW